MYIQEDMIDLGLSDGEKWPSRTHRVAAQNLLLCNPAITSRETLMAAVDEIVALDEARVRTITLGELREACPFCASLVDVDRVRNGQEPLP